MDTSIKDRVKFFIDAFYNSKDNNLSRLVKISDKYDIDLLGISAVSNYDMIKYDFKVNNNNINNNITYDATDYIYKYWKYRCYKIINIIKSLSMPKIICFNSIQYDEMEYIIKKLNCYNVVYYSSLNDRNHMKYENNGITNGLLNCILYNKYFINFTDECVNLNDGSGDKFTQKTLCCKFSLKSKSNKKFYIIIHKNASHSKNGKRQLSILTKNINEKLDLSLPIIMFADMNTHPVDVNNKKKYMWSILNGVNGNIEESYNMSDKFITYSSDYFNLENDEKNGRRFDYIFNKNITCMNSIDLDDFENDIVNNCYKNIINEEKRIINKFVKSYISNNNNLELLIKLTNTVTPSYSDIDIDFDWFYSVYKYFINKILEIHSYKLSYTLKKKDNKKNKFLKLYGTDHKPLYCTFKI